MRKLFLLAGLLLSISFTSCNKNNSRVKAKRIVMIGLDGISVNGYQTAKHPNLDKLMADGILSLTTRNVMPSVTLPNWTSHLTGSGPEQHGILSNGWRKNKIELPTTLNAYQHDGYLTAVTGMHFKA